DLLAKRAAAFDALRESKARAAPAGGTAAINARIARSEQQLLDPAGLPRRAWYKHMLYAPGLYTGYGVKTLPGVREAIEQGDYEGAAIEIGRVAKALEREASWLEGITKDLSALK